MVSRMDNTLYATRAEAATFLGVSLRTIDRYIEDGTLTAFRIRGIQSVRVKVADLDNILERKAAKNADVGAQ